MPTSIAELSADELQAADECERRFYYEDRPGEFVLRLLRLMQDMEPHGVPINIYRHQLQAATRCLRAGGSEELVVVALLHDIGGAFSADNHASISAEILRPFVSEENVWLLEHHALFQRYFYADKLGLDKSEHERYRDHPCYAATMRFVEDWDQAAFDPAYEELPLSHFEPMVRRIFGRRPGWK